MGEGVGSDKSETGTQGSGPVKVPETGEEEEWVVFPPPGGNTPPGTMSVQRSYTVRTVSVPVKVNRRIRCVQSTAHRVRRTCGTNRHLDSPPPRTKGSVSESNLSLIFGELKPIIGRLPEIEVDTDWVSISEAKSPSPTTSELIKPSSLFAGKEKQRVGKEGRTGETAEGVSERQRETESESKRKRERLRVERVGLTPPEKERENFKDRKVEKDTEQVSDRLKKKQERDKTRRKVSETESEKG